jgi:hypothetical protein
MRNPRASFLIVGRTANVEIIRSDERTIRKPGTTLRGQTRFVVPGFAEALEPLYCHRRQQWQALDDQDRVLKCR